MRDEIRDAMRRYPASTARTRAALDAALSGKPDGPDRGEAAELAAEMLGRYGITADDIREGIAEGGSIGILAFRDDAEDGGRR